MFTLQVQRNEQTVVAEPVTQVTLLSHPYQTHPSYFYSRFKLFPYIQN